MCAMLALSVLLAFAAGVVLSRVVDVAVAFAWLALRVALVRWCGRDGRGTAPTVVWRASPRAWDAERAPDLPWDFDHGWGPKATAHPETQRVVATAARSQPCQNCIAWAADGHGWLTRWHAAIAHVNWSLTERHRVSPTRSFSRAFASRRAQPTPDRCVSTSASASIAVARRAQHCTCVSRGAGRVGWSQARGGATEGETDAPAPRADRASRRGGVGLPLVERARPGCRFSAGAHGWDLRSQWHRNV